MTTILRQGVDEGVFHVTSPEATARVLVSLFQGMNEDGTGAFLALEAEPFPLKSRGQARRLHRGLRADPRGSVGHPHVHEHLR